jgi:CRISPR-associated protein Csb2
MFEHLRISVHFLDGEFHGRGDNGESEWPPSPLRLFQALTNAAARLDGNGISDRNANALRGFEALKQPPEIVADKVTTTNGYQLYVPDNVGDLVAKQWAAGKYFDGKNHPIDISGYRTEKRVRPLRLADAAAVHYLWTFDDAEFAKYRETLITLARAITHFGWGVDLVVADAAVEKRDETFTSFSGEHWLPVETSGGASLRVPVVGTLTALDEHHAAFLSRIKRRDDGSEIFVPVPPLSTFRVVTYRRATELSQPPYAVFALRRPDDSGFAAFDPQWRRLHLTGMFRHTASQPAFASAVGWDKSKVDAFVLGHDKSDPTNIKPTASIARLVFIPLPSLEWRGEVRGSTVGAIRRVLVMVSGRCDTSEFLRVVRALEGQELIDEKSKHPVAFLRRQSEKDNAISAYIQSATTWATVTPVILPGYDDPRKLRHRLRAENNNLTTEEKTAVLHKLDKRVEFLLRKAMRQAGFSESLAQHALLEWRGGGFLPGTELASRYSVPDQHRRYRRLHVRITWRSSEGLAIPVPGPICIGGGKYSGLGLFVPVTDSK